jgi:hypothetical protein
VPRLALLALVVSFGAGAQEDPVHQIARAYLDALVGVGDDAARESLLGGVTMNASIATIGSWRIIAEDPVRKESGALQTAAQLMTDLDKAGRATLANLLTQSGAVGNDVEVRELSEAEANRLLAPTKERASRFVRTLPVLAYIARVSKPVYWHPKNPIRPLLVQAGTNGTYSLEVHRMTIESLEGPRKEVRRWPLRVLRFTTSRGLDTGWKILPASDWNGD